MKEQVENKVKVQKEILDYNNIAFCMQCMDYVVPEEVRSPNEIKIYCPICSTEIEKKDK